MSFRKEKKYKLTVSEQNILKNKLVEKGMKLLYPKRKVNSIYFDTKDLDFYLNSEEGVLPRKKMRLRWYDKDIKKSLKKQKSHLLKEDLKLLNLFYIIKIFLKIVFNF